MLDEMPTYAFGESEAEDPFLPAWLYIVIFFIPATISFITLYQLIGLDLLFSGIVALAVMNGSINSIIAILTIRLDGHSQEALGHLESIIAEMERFEKSLDQANTMVTSFTDDLEEAKELFTRVGINLNELDLDPVAEVVEKLKENKDGLSEVLDNLREVNVTEYIDQARGIDWKGLLDAAEEIMEFIKSKSSLSSGIKTIPTPDMGLPTLREREFFTRPAVQHEEAIVLEPTPRRDPLNPSPPKAKPEKPRWNLNPSPKQ